jgi:hypothetical protein
MPAFADDLFLGTANGYQGTGQYPTTAVFAGSVSTTTMTVTQMLSGDPIVLGMYVDGSGITDGSYVTAFVSGSGGTGTYTVSASSSATGAITIYGSTQASLQNPAPMPQGVGPLGRVYIWDLVPQVLGAANIAASQTPTGAGALTLTAGTAVKSVVRSDGVTVLQLDCPRAVSVTTGAGTPTSSTFTVVGYDIYGQPMSEAIASGTVASTTTPGKKAFYQIVSVTGTAATAVTITCGTTDVFGSPVRFIDAGYIVKVGWNNTLLQNAGTFAVADTATATTTTGDVRGTFKPTSAADGIKRLVMTIALPAISVGPNATRTGAFGVTQA